MAIATYTPPQGLTPQGTQQNSLSQSLSAIQGLAPFAGANVTPQQVAQSSAQATAFGQNAPNYFQGQEQSLFNQSGIPALQQKVGDLTSLFPLWLADQNLSQKYSSSQLKSGSSPVYGLSNTPNPITGQVSGVANPYLNSPTDLINSVTQSQGQGFQGFSSPGMNTQAMGEVPAAVNSLVGIANNAMTTEEGLIGGKMSDAKSQYQSALDSLLGTANIFSQLYNAQNAYASSSSSSSTNTQYIEAQAQQDAANGMTLHDMIVKYRGVADPNSIYQVYNLYNTGANNKTFQKGKGGWGEAKESPDQLYAWGITQAKPTAAYVKQQQAVKDQQSASVDTYNTAKGMMKAYQDAGVLRFIPYADHLIPGVATAQSQLFQSLSSLRRGAIGGRITQQEIKWLTDKLFPSPYDTPQVMQSKVDTLKKKMDQFLSDPTASVGPDGEIYFNSKSPGAGVSSGSSGGGGSNPDPLGIL